MKKYLLLFSFLISFLHIGASDVYEVIIQGQVISLDGTSAIGVEVKFVPDDSSNVVGQEFITRTDENGHFEFRFETEVDAGCGQLFSQACDPDFFPHVICYSRDQPLVEIEIPFCHNVNPCVDFIHIDQYPFGNGQIELVLALPEDRVYDVLWSTGETSHSIIGVTGDEYCVKVFTSDCTSSRCIIAGRNTQCNIRIHQEWSIEGMAVLYAESYGQEIVEYHWSNGSQEPFIEVADTGTYCLEVVLADGCLASDCIDVEPWHNDCWAYIFEYINDAGDRVLAVESIWAHRIYSYHWSTGDTTATIIPDSTGRYSVTITTETGCTFTSEYYFISAEDCQVEIYVDQGWEPFFGGATLYAEALPPYGINYQWSTGESEPFITVVENGAYCVTITNDQGCDATHCVTVDLDSLWNGQCHIFIEEQISASGEIGLAVAGWYSPNSNITWSTGETGRLIYPQENGEYCVTVSNGNGCEAEACYFYNGGRACHVEVQTTEYEEVVYLYPHPYGVPPFNYEWSDGTTGDFITVPESGEYCVTMTDATGCISRWCGYVSVNEYEFCEAYIGVERNQDGSIFYRVYAFGEAPFEYIWNHDRLEGDSVVIDEPGVYCVDVIDASGCIITTCVDVPPSDACRVYIDYTVGFAGDTILYVVVDPNVVYKVLWDNGSTEHEIVYDGNPVCVTITTAEGCTTRACWDGFPNPGKYHLTGMVSDPELDYILDLDSVTFYHMNSDSVINVTRADVKIRENTFFAALYESGLYLIKADVEGYVPTYYKSAIHWQDAIPVGVDDATVALVYDITMIPEDSNNGEGQVTGAVIMGENVRMNIGTRYGNGHEGAEIILTTLEGDPLQAVYTDANGEFILEGIPFGTYYVVLEIAGLPQQRIEVTISTDQLIVEGLVFDLEAAGNDSTSGVNSEHNIDFKLYPNPASDRIEVIIDGKNSGGSLFTFRDLSGKVVWSEVRSYKNGEKIQLDVTSLNPGNMYILVIQGQNDIGMKKFFIAR
jgi:hypothetical protein